MAWKVLFNEFIIIKLKGLEFPKVNLTLSRHTQGYDIVCAM